MSDSSVTPWTVALQAPLSMGFPRQEYWSGCPFPFPGDLSNPGIEHMSLTWRADSLPLSDLGSPCIQLVERYTELERVLERIKVLYTFNKEACCFSR